MFIIASSLREAGFFEWIGLHLARSVDAHPIMMYILLPLMTAGMASLLDIVTVALFVVPLTVQVLDGLEIDPVPFVVAEVLDRKSTRLNSSHRCISYAVFCLKKKKTYLHC